MPHRGNDDTAHLAPVSGSQVAADPAASTASVWAVSHERRYNWWDSDVLRADELLARLEEHCACTPRACTAKLSLLNVYTMMGHGFIIPD